VGKETALENAYNMLFVHGCCLPKKKKKKYKEMEERKRKGKKRSALAEINDMRR
jgi:hypothetical protein